MAERMGVINLVAVKRNGLTLRKQIHRTFGTTMGWQVTYQHLKRWMEEWDLAIAYAAEVDDIGIVVKYEVFTRDPMGQLSSPGPKW